MSEELKNTTIQMIDAVLKSAGVAALTFVVQHLQAWENNGSPLLPFSIVPTSPSCSSDALATSAVTPSEPAK